MNKRSIAAFIFLSLIGIIIVLRFDGNYSLSFRTKKNLIFKHSEKISKIVIDSFYNWDFPIEKNQEITLKDTSIIAVIEDIIKSPKSNEGMIYKEAFYCFDVHFFTKDEELIGCRIKWNEDKQTLEIGFYDDKRVTRDFYKINKELRDRLFEYVRSNLQQEELE